MQNSKFNRNIPSTFSRIELNAPMKVILEFYKSNINSLSKKDKSILVQTFVYPTSYFLTFKFLDKLLMFHFLCYINKN